MARFLDFFEYFWRDVQGFFLVMHPSFEGGAY